MKEFYIQDKLVLTSSRLTNEEFRIYNYICANYNVTKLKPYIRLVDICGYFHFSMERTKEILNKLSQIEINEKKLLNIFYTGAYVDFEMPHYQSFLIDLGFKKFSSAAGFKNIKNKITELNTKADTKIYLFPTLDQFDLSDALRDMPDEDFEKIKPDQLRFPWVYHDEKARRTDTQ